MKITYLEIQKYLYGNYFVSYDTECTKNMCKSKVMNKEEILKLIQESL